MQIEEITIRPYQLTDLPYLLEITAEVFGPVSIDLNMETKFGPFGEGDWRSRKKSAIVLDCEAQPDGVFVALVGQRVAGYITTRLNKTSGIGWIPNLAVGSEFQMRGIGQRLLTHAVNYMRESGMEIAKIETLEQNPIGKKLYPAIGFEPVATQIHYAMRLTDLDTTINE
ncbi:MAG: N-acetyltransferase [Chthonomonadales bacterium]